MHYRFAKAIVSLALAIMCCLSRVDAQQGRDFVREDDEGHLILRFAGGNAEELDAEEDEEIVDAFVSVMVHDRLAADISFEAEPEDAAWAGPMEGRLGHYLSNVETPLRPTLIECRALSCRVVFEHTQAWRVSEHQSLLDRAQHVMEGLIDSTPDRFEERFLLAAYSQEGETQHIKVFLRRADEP